MIPEKDGYYFFRELENEWGNWFWKWQICLVENGLVAFFDHDGRELEDVFFGEPIEMPPQPDPVPLNDDPPPPKYIEFPEWEGDQQ